MECACCDLIQDLYLSFCLFSKIINIKIYKTIILSVLLCGCEAKEQHIEVTYKRGMIRMFEPKRNQKQDRENYIMKSSIIFTLHEILGGSNQEG